MQAHLMAGWTGTARTLAKQRAMAVMEGFALANAAELRSRGHAAAACDEGHVHDALREWRRQSGDGVLVGSGSSMTAAKIACFDHSAMSERCKCCFRLQTVCDRVTPHLPRWPWVGLDQRPRAVRKRALRPCGATRPQLSPGASQQVHQVLVDST